MMSKFENDTEVQSPFLSQTSQKLSRQNFMPSHSTVTCDTARKIRKEDGMTYIVIVNKNTGQEMQAQIPTIDDLRQNSLSNSSMQFSPDEFQNAYSNTKFINHKHGPNSTKFSRTFQLEESPQFDIKPKSKVVPRARGIPLNEESLKLNFSNIGFDAYDSSMTSQTVFKDEEQEGITRSQMVVDEGYEDKIDSSSVMEIGELPQLCGIKNMTRKRSQSPLFFQNARNVQDQDIKKVKTPLMDLSGSSGYYSGGSSFYSPQTDITTPSPLQGYHRERNPIFLVSPGVRNMSSLSSSLEARAASPLVSSPLTPVTSLASNLKSVNLFQSPSPISQRAPDPRQHLVTKIKRSISPSVSKHSPLVSDAQVHRHLMQQHLIKRTSSPVEPIKRKLCHLAALPQNQSSKAINAPPQTQSSKLMTVQPSDKSKNRDVPQVSSNNPHSDKAAPVQHIKSEPICTQVEDDGHATSHPGDVVIHFDFRDKETIVEVEKPAEHSEDSQDCVSSSQESLKSSVRGKVLVYSMIKSIQQLKESYSLRFASDNAIIH